MELGSANERRTFSREFKIEAVKLVTKRGLTVARACRELELSESVLRRWMRALEDAPLGAFPGNGRPSAEQAGIVASTSAFPVAPAP